MKVVICSIVFIMIASTAFAGDLKVKIGDRDITLKLTSIKHEIREADRHEGGRDSAVACSFLFYSLLAKGDIQEASKLKAGRYQYSHA